MKRSLVPPSLQGVLKVVHLKSTIVSHNLNLDISMLRGLLDVQLDLEIRAEFQSDSNL